MSDLRSHRRLRREYLSAESGAVLRVVGESESGNSVAGLLAPERTDGRTRKTVGYPGYEGSLLTADHGTRCWPRTNAAGFAHQHIRDGLDLGVGGDNAADTVGCAYVDITGTSGCRFLP